MGKQSPLYGRKTGQIELRPFDFFESRRFFPGASFETSLALYSMVGGIPLYLQQLDPSKSMEENVAAAFLDASSILYDEPANLLKQEVSKAATYNAVISAVAGGASQHNEIATQAGIESAALDYYLKELVRLDLLEKELPITPGGRGTWRITDHLFRFWYRYVRSRQPMVERGLGARAAAWIVDALPEYVGFVFEEACRVWLWRAYAGGLLDVEVTGIGRWWGNDPVAKGQAEIDVVAVRDGRAVLVGECKWRNEATGADVLSALDERAHLAARVLQVRLYRRLPPIGLLAARSPPHHSRQDGVGARRQTHPGVAAHFILPLYPSDERFQIVVQFEDANARGCV